MKNPFCELFNKILNSNVKGFSLLSYSGKIADKVEKISEEIFNTYYEITNEKYKKVKIQGDAAEDLIDEMFASLN